MDLIYLNKSVTYVMKKNDKKIKEDMTEKCSNMTPNKNRNKYKNKNKIKNRNKIKKNRNNYKIQSKHDTMRKERSRGRQLFK